MGAAIRQATRLLQGRHEHQKILLLLTDGKPNDLDLYEGRYGVEDTRMAVQEAHKAGLTPFCVTIDDDANEYLPYVFGSNHFVVIKDPTQLPLQLPKLYEPDTLTPMQAPASTRQHLPGDLAVWFFIFAELAVFGILFISFGVARSFDPDTFASGRQVLHPGPV